MTTVVISPFMTVNFDGGGHFWVYLQYVEGLRQAGCEVYWFERVPRDQPRPDDARVEAWLGQLERYGLGGRVILDRGADGDPRGQDFVGLTRSTANTVFERADLLLNFHYALDASVLARFRRTALVDIDPGLLQMWMSTGQVVVAPHDVYFTTGETVGTPSARFPDCGIAWRHIRPPVCLESWPYTYDPQCEAFTTVSDWWGGWAPEIVDGRQVLYDNNKRVSFLAFAQLARLTSQPLELAINLAECDEADRILLEQHGWRVRQATAVSRTPETYRDYIRSSRGEISCVKPSCVKLQNAWIGDRSLCYLASGKPVVVQDTGPSSYLPSGEGLFRFTTPAEAADALAVVNADYEENCSASREIAAAYFDAATTAEHILNAALQRSATDPGSWCREGRR